MKTMEESKPGFMAVREYFEREESAFEKSEFFEGELFAKTGASVNHNHIALNVGAELRDRLKERPCLVFPGDIKVQMEHGRHYVYPDASVVCEEIEYGMGRKDVIANPVVVVEVLSPSTRVYDSRDKFAAYRELPPLREYILIHRDRVMVEQFINQSPDLWQLRIYRRVLDDLRIEAVETVLPLTEIYRNVQFEKKRRITGRPRRNGLSPSTPPPVHNRAEAPWPTDADPRIRNQRCMTTNVDVKRLFNPPPSPSRSNT